MDPFLEHPYFFPDLHSSLNYCIRQLLQRLLPQPYYAVLNERLWVETSERSMEPDVDVLIDRSQPKEVDVAIVEGIVAPAAQPLVITIPHDERREMYVDIMTRNDLDERVVTTIEVLSLSNKTPGEHGRNLYLQKQREVVDGEINLVEIDLLRGGVHSTSVPRRRVERRGGRFDYHVCIKRGDIWAKRFVYTIRLEDRLPVVEVPLLPGDAPVKLDLQAVFDRAYDDGPFSRRVPYEVDRIVPPLPPQQLEWVVAQLKQRT
jgi:hypothetical protein